MRNNVIPQDWQEAADGAPENCICTAEVSLESPKLWAPLKAQ